MTETDATRSLRDVRREQATERRRLKEQQNRTRERLDQTASKMSSEEAQRIRRHNAVVTGMVPRIAGAVDSWARKRVPLKVEHPAMAFYAATDFTSIEIQIPETEDVDLDFAADLRGLAYHEAGHILKSLPFPVLLDAIMPLDPDTGSANMRMRTLPKLVGLPLPKIHQAWNVLEDQRMESAMVRESINLGRYYNVIVLEHVLNGGVSDISYLWVYGRNHVEETVRVAARKAMVIQEGEEAVQEAERLIDAYKQATDPLTMWESVVKFGQLIGRCKSSDDLGDGAMDDHQIDPYSDPQPFDLDDSAEPMPGDGDDESDEDEDESKGTSGGKADQDDDEDDAEDQETGDTADRHAHSEADDDLLPDAPGASNSVNDPEWDRKLVTDALDKARERRNNDGQVQNDVRAFNHALQEGANKLPFARIPYTVEPDPLVTNEAIRLNRGLRNLMEQARAESAPTWQTQQRQGVLDVRAYITRQPGDLEYYKRYAEGGDMRLPNMAVSLVLDGSGSMDRHAQSLAISAFGVKSACDVVGVPCTVTVYDTAAYLLWDEDDRPLDVPYNIVPSGGTDPKRALDMLDMQKADKANHLVIIMTDGQWSHRWRRDYSLAHYGAADRDIVMFYLNCDPAQGPAGVETCSLATRIDDLQEIPRFLMRYIIRAM